MPALSSIDLDIFRSHPHTVTRYLAYMDRPEILSGQVNGSPLLDSVSGGVYAFDYDNSTGDFNDVELYMTIEFGTTPGARDIGVSRIRKVPTSTRIFIAETSLGKLPITNNTYFSIKIEWRPWPKIPRLVAVKDSSGIATSFTEYHDYDLAYSNQNSFIEPIANITRSATSRTMPDPAGYVDSGQIYRTVSMSSAFSKITANGASFSSRLWDVGDGTITVGTDTTETITVQFPVGKRWISLTITDSNGKSKKHYFPILVFDEDNQPLREMLPGDQLGFKVTADNRIDGRIMGFEIFGKDNTLDIYEGQVAVYWEKANFGIYDAPATYITSFMGWATKDAETLKMHNRTRYTTEIAGIQYWLASFNGYAQKVSERPTVNRWFKFPNNTLTVDRVAHYILREYSTALSITNMYFGEYTHNVKAEDFKKDKIWSQIVELEKGNLMTQVTCDSMGAIWLKTKYEYMQVTGDPTINRTDRDKVIHLTKSDWTDAPGLVIDYTYVDKVSIVDSSGSRIKNDKNILLFAKAPGLVPRDSGSEEELPFQRLPYLTNSIRKLTQLVGHHDEQANNPRENVTLNLIGNYDFIEPAWCEPVTITWSENSLRGTIVNTEEFIVTGISVAHSNDVGVAPKKITWTLKQATIGEPGVQYFPPKSNSGSVTPSIKFPKINIPLYLPGEWINLPPSVPGLAIFTGLASGDFLYRSSNFGNGSNFTRVNTALGGFGFCFKVDPYSPLYLNTGTAVNGWILTTTNVYRIIDIFAVSLTINNVKTLTTTLNSTYHDNSLVMSASRRVQNWVMILGSKVGGLDLYWTTDGSTWALVDIDDGLGLTSAPEYYPFIYASPTIGGLGYAAFTDTNGSGLGYIFRTFDYGATWIDITPSAGDCKRVLHIPYSGNINSLIIYYEDVSGNVIKWNSANDTVIDTFPLPDTGEVATLQTSDLNSNFMTIVMSSSNDFIYVSRNGGKIFSIRRFDDDVAQITMSSVRPESFYAINPNPASHIDIFSTKDFGITIEDLSGDIGDFVSPPALGFIGWCGSNG